ncbi:MAG TPA: PDZ domain-containing protein [Pyrinomonadaceae bacterium]|jgi:C-terminal processing protease CtpA/Prc
MFRTKTLLSLALLLLTLCAANAPAQEAQEARRAQTEGAYAFAFSGNHLGVSVESVTRENMGSFNLRGEPRGVAVREVAENGPAAKAGLQKNDVILRFDGEQVSSAQKLQRLINESAPEHTARLSISRGGAEQELSVTLGRREAFTPRAFGELKLPDVQAFGMRADELKRHAEKWQRDSEEWKKRAKDLDRNSQEMRRNLEEKFRAEGFGDNFKLVYGGGGRRIGITTQELTGQLANYFGVSERGGLLITSVAENSPAAKAGLRAGDVVNEVDGTRLRNAGELSRALSRRDEGDVTLTITRDRKTRTIKVTPDRTQNSPTLYTPGGFGPAIAPMALSAPRISVAPMQVKPARPAMPAPPAAPRLAPFAVPRSPAAPRIYPMPAIPARPGVWVL